MDYPNDRNNLVLLELKECKTRGDKRRISFLLKKYPDNGAYRDKIIDELDKRKLVEYINGEAKQDENGDFRYVNDLPKYYQTSSAGKLALKNKLFPSESFHKTEKNRIRYLQVIGITIAALGGLITIGSFFGKLIDSFFK